MVLSVLASNKRKKISMKQFKSVHAKQMHKPCMTKKLRNAMQIHLLKLTLNNVKSWQELNWRKQMLSVRIPPLLYLPHARKSHRPYYKRQVHHVMLLTVLACNKHKKNSMMLLMCVFARNLQWLSMKKRS